MTLLIKEGCQKQHYQDYIGISAYSSIRVTQGVESNNYTGWTRI